MIRAIYSVKPSFPATDQGSGCVRYQVGAWWVDADSPPVQADVDAIVLPDPRLVAVDASIAGFSFGGQTLAQLKAMDNATWDAWWAANITNIAQASALLKFLARTVLRKLL